MEFTFANAYDLERFLDFSKGVDDSPCLLKVKKGEEELTVLLAHGRSSKPFAFKKEKVNQADMIICCHPHMLREDQRRKHIFPNHIGKVKGFFKFGKWELSPV